MEHNWFGAQLTLYSGWNRVMLLGCRFWLMLLGCRYLPFWVSQSFKLLVYLKHTYNCLEIYTVEIFISDTIACLHHNAPCVTEDSMSAHGYNFLYAWSLDCVESYSSILLFKSTTLEQIHCSLFFRVYKPYLEGHTSWLLSYLRATCDML